MTREGERERDDPALRGSVRGCRADAAVAGRDGREGRDAARAAGRPEMLRCGTCQEERRLQVGIDLPVPGLLGHVDEGLAPEHPRRQHDSHHVAKVCRGIADQPRVRRDVVDVHGHCLMSGTRKGRHDRPECCLVAVHGAHAGTRIGERPGGRGTDPLSGTRDDDAMTVEPPSGSIHVHSFILRAAPHPPLAIGHHTPQDPWRRP